jgi:hypothetical protein
MLSPPPSTTSFLGKYHKTTSFANHIHPSHISITISIIDMIQIQHILHMLTILSREFYDDNNEYPIPLVALLFYS